MTEEQNPLSDVVEQDQPFGPIRLTELTVVGLGGSIGVGLRSFLGDHLPHVRLGRQGFDLSPLLFINTFGALLLGLLLAFFASTPRHHVRLLVTTGVLGGFTSYGALAELTRQQIVDHAPVATVLIQIGGSLGLGLLGFVAGHLLGKRLFEGDKR